MPHRSTSTENKRKQAAATAERSPDEKTRRRGSSQHDSSSIQEFLDRFATAMTSGDTEAVSELWEAPAFVIDEQASIAVSSLDDVERFFAGAKDQYNERGITTT